MQDFSLETNAAMKRPWSDPVCNRPSFILPDTVHFLNAFFPNITLSLRQCCQSAQPIAVSPTHAQWGGNNGRWTLQSCSIDGVLSWQCIHRMQLENLILRAKLEQTITLLASYSPIAKPPSIHKENILLPIYKTWDKWSNPAVGAIITVQII